MDVRSAAKISAAGSASKGAEDLGLTPDRKRLREASSGSEGDDSPFTEVTRRSATSKDLKRVAASEPMYVETVKDTVRDAPSRSNEDLVFIEFVGHQINKLNSVLVKRELASTVEPLSMVVSGNYLRVRSKNAEEKARLMALTQIGPYTVRVSEPRKLVRERAGNTRKFVRKVIVGVPVDIDDREIQEELAASTRVVAAKRILKKREGILIKTTAVVIDFAVGNEVPCKVLIGFSRYKVREYVAPFTRCYKCLSFDHVAVHCKKGQKCSLCAGEHRYTDR